MMIGRGFYNVGLLCRGFGLMYPGVWIAGAAVVAIAVTVAIVLAVKKKRQAPSDGAAEALKLRYIKGELTEEDYLKMKDVLGK